MLFILRKDKPRFNIVFLQQKFLMIQIGRNIVSFDVLEEKFCCDLGFCKGVCCVHGDSGAPLEKDEAEILENVFPKVKPYLRKESILSIEKQGFYIIDSDGDLVTPLLNGKECAYAYFENGIAKCAIEKAYFDKKIAFRKPVSCHLYPIRITDYKEFSAVNYHKWEICAEAVKKGKKENIPVYIFLKDALIRKYGQEWYNELIIAKDLYDKKP